ncbi:UTRA domain protein [Mycobacterium kansasii]|uniref:UTRA domain protein n=1 Tax=Mycobacterium kansasii TaxID=1768 RepID=A0A1V3X7Z1_MYCKA|nr:UTRA domain protein [Mycobacterium kansasii]
MTVRSAVGILERQGWLVRRQGLGTFVADPVRQELGSGVRTITEVLLSSGVTPRVEVLSQSVCAPPQPIAAALALPEVLGIRRRFSAGDEPLALVTAYLPPSVGDAVEPLLSGALDTETTYTMWEQRLGIRIAKATHDISAAGASAEVAGRWSCRWARRCWCSTAPATAKTAKRSRWWCSITAPIGTGSPSHCRERCPSRVPESSKGRNSHEDCRIE